MLRQVLAFIGCGIIVGTASCAPKSTSVATVSSSDTPTTSEATTEIVLGDVSADEPLRKIEQFQPLADYLAANLQEFGIGAGEVKIVRDLSTMAENLDSGEIDLYFDSPYPSLTVMSLSEAQPLLRQSKEGVDEYYSVFFTNNDSGIETLADLKGQILGLDTEYSTSGYFLPTIYLKETQETNLARKESETDSVAADEIGYYFTRDDENTIQYVVSGRLVAGAVDYPTYLKIPEDTRRRLKIIGQTQKVPRQLVLTAADMEPELKAAIKSLLIELPQQPKGKEILADFEATVEFDELSTAQSWQEVQELYQKKRDDYLSK